MCLGCVLYFINSDLISKLSKVFNMWLLLELKIVFFKNIIHCDKNKGQVNKKLSLRFE